MSVPVLLYPPSFSMKHSITREILVNEYGDGYHQVLSQESLYTRADGVGGLTPHYGVVHFNISYLHMIWNYTAEEIWDFFRDRLDRDNEPFYFYNPSENLVIDPTGSNTVGRYLVRLASPNEGFSREYVKYLIFSNSGIDLEECRDWDAGSLLTVSNAFEPSETLFPIETRRGINGPTDTVTIQLNPPSYRAVDSLSWVGNDRFALTLSTPPQRPFTLPENVNSVINDMVSVSKLDMP